MTRRGFFLLSGTAVLAAAAFRGFTRNSVASETGETFEVTKTDAEWKAILTDEQYRSVMALVERWRALPQPSYSLDRRNCVSFVAEVATSLGLQADPRGLMRRPRAFLDRVRDRNAATIAASSASSGVSVRKSR